MNAFANDEAVKIGYVGSWASTTPYDQSTFIGHAIISNKFEPLLEIDQYGILKPLAAKSWEVDQNFTHFVFHIDMDRTFSNGEKLTSYHFKRNFEESSQVKPQSYNKTNEDALYDIEKIETPDEKTLIIKYRKPFRLALQNFSHARYSAITRDASGKLLGTGPFEIEEVDKKHLKLYSKGKLQYEVKNVLKNEVAKSLENGTIDVLGFPVFEEFSLCQNNSSLQCFVGEEHSHIIFVPNALEGHLFKKSHLRLAFQYLVNDILNNLTPSSYLYDSIFFDRNPQIYLKMQKGHLEKEEEVRNLIDSGRPFVKELIDETKKKPLQMISVYGNLGLVEELRKRGLQVEYKDSNDVRAIIQQYYSGKDFDICLFGVSVQAGDPDSIYHSLGKHGAILFPSAYREKVAELLEEGRSLIEPSQIHPHYQKVSRQVLIDVPYVHLGFMRDGLIYRSDRVRLDFTSKYRTTHNYNLYKKI